jgi:hypothetical protein
MAARGRFTSVIGLILGLGWGTSALADAQQLAPLPLKQCHDLAIAGKMAGILPSRQDAQHSGRFEVTVDLHCRGETVELRNLEIHPQDLTDTKVQRVRAEGGGIDYVGSIGRAVAPTVFIAGRCISSGDLPGPNCRFWLMLVSNLHKSPDLVAFAVADNNGQRLAYGAGPVGEGGVDIAGVD